MLHLSTLAHSRFECEAYFIPVLFSLCFTSIRSLNMLGIANTWWWGTVIYMHIYAHTNTHTTANTTHTNTVTFALIPSNLSFLHARLRTATLRHDEEGQVNIVLRCTLTFRHSTMHATCNKNIYLKCLCCCVGYSDELASAQLPSLQPL